MGYLKYSDYLADRAQKSILQIYNLETGSISRVAEFDHVIEAPNWTQDGKTLVFNSKGKLFFINLETGDVQEIDTGIADTCNNDHVLSPDGKQIGFSSGENDDMNSRIFILNLENQDVHCSVADNLSYLHGWSADGKTISYCACRAYGGIEEWDIYTKPVAGGLERRLTYAPGLNDGPEFSADNNKIWFNSVRSGLMQIYRMNRDGSDQTQMTFDEEFNSWFPHISPDMKKVVYIAYHKEDLEPGEHMPDKNVEIRMIPAEGGEPETLVRLFGGQGSMNVNSWSPDSKKFAFVSYEE